jgi:hypothetical protein
LTAFGSVAHSAAILSSNIDVMVGSDRPVGFFEFIWKKKIFESLTVVAWNLWRQLASVHPCMPLSSARPSRLPERNAGLQVINVLIGNKSDILTA